MKKITILLLLASNLCYGQVKDFLLRNGKIFQMRAYDSTAIANAIALRLLKTDSASVLGYSSRWRTQHLIDSLSIAFTPVNIYNSDGSITGNRSIQGDGGIFSINGMDLAINAITGERIAMGGFAGGGVSLIGGSTDITSSALTVFKDSIWIIPKLGQINIYSLRTGNIGNDLVTWDANGKLGHLASDSSRIPNFHTKVKSLFSATTPVTYNPTTGLIAIDQSTTSANGYLSNTDWNTFNNKLSSIDSNNISNFHLKVKSLFSGTAPVTYNSTTGAIGISQATTSTNGYVSSTDWNTFNNKLATNGSAASLTSFPTLNQSTLGSAATLTTPRAIYGNNFDGSAALAQIIASTYGGTGNGFAKLSGPSGSEKTFTLPNASSTILTDNALVSVAQGGTGIGAIGTGIATWWGTPSSANLASAITDETGSGVSVFGTSPSFTTDIRSPLVIGSTSANGTLTLEGNNTTGNTSTNANLVFKVGNSAATTAMQILNAGNVLIGAPTADANQSLNIQSITNTAADGIKIYALNLSANMKIGYQSLLTSGSMIVQAASTGVEIVGPSGTGASVGSAATAPTSTLSVFGSFSTAYIAKSANYTLTATDNVVEVTTGSNTQTLPTAVGITGRNYTITNSGTGVVTVGTTSSQTFVNVSGTPTTLTLNQFNTVRVISNGANWLRVSSL